MKKNNKIKANTARELEMALKKQTSDHNHQIMDEKNQSLTNLCAFRSSSTKIAPPLQ